jgi:hypothetical protein
MPKLAVNGAKPGCFHIFFINRSGRTTDRE